MTMTCGIGRSIAFICCLHCFPPSQAAEASQGDDPMTPLRKIQDLVGHWRGTGTSDSSKGWDEAAECAWKFRKDGRCSLYVKIQDGKAKAPGRQFDEVAIAFDANNGVYTLKAYKAGDSTDAALVQFQGKLVSESNLVFDRIDKGTATDPLDRIDFKFINGGDRVVYTVHRRVGQSRHYRRFGQVSWDRDGTSLAGSAAEKPKCVVTGGAATLTVAYKGQSYPVCCTGCREMFLENPERFLAKINKKAK